MNQHENGAEQHEQAERSAMSVAREQLKGMTAPQLLRQRMIWEADYRRNGPHHQTAAYLVVIHQMLEKKNRGANEHDG